MCFDELVTVEIYPIPKNTPTVTTSFVPVDNSYYPDLHNL